MPLNNRQCPKKMKHTKHIVFAYNPGFYIYSADAGQCYGVIDENTCDVRIVQRFGGGLVFKAHRLLYHSTLGLE